MSRIDALALLVIGVTIVGVALGRYPFLRMNRATIALAGATLLLAIGAISLDEAYGLLDLNTLTLLFAMMILNVNLRLAGFFELVGSRVVKLARTPRQLLALIILAAGCSRPSSSTIRLSSFSRRWWWKSASTCASRLSPT